MLSSAPTRLASLRLRLRRASLPALLSAVATLCAPALAAADPLINPSDDDIRIVPQLLVGTAGFEPGVALEYRSDQINYWNLRPEVFFSEDVRIGAGLSALYDFGPVIAMSDKSSFEIGPRVVYHNADHTGWEADALAEYAVSLSDDPKPFRHTVGLLGALGLRQDKDNGDRKIELGASIGGFYAFRF